MHIINVSLRALYCVLLLLPKVHVFRSACRQMHRPAEANAHGKSTAKCKREEWKVQCGNQKNTHQTGKKIIIKCSQKKALTKQNLKHLLYILCAIIWSSVVNFNVLMRVLRFILFRAAAHYVCSVQCALACRCASRIFILSLISHLF